MVSATKLAWHVSRSRLFQKAHHVAFFLPNDGEIDLRPLLTLAWQQGKHCYLPVLGMRHENRMWFMPYTPGDVLLSNRFGIPEPVLSRDLRYYKNWMLDLVLVPLVGFDQDGNRLGMGGGYYDRTFAYLGRRTKWRRPHLMGVGFDMQECKTVPVSEWDIPLDSVATESGIREFR